MPRRPAPVVTPGRDGAARGVLLAPKPATSTACDKIDERRDGQDARIDERLAQIEAKIHELDRKLSALITALNTAEQIRVALDGQLLDPSRATGHLAASTDAVEAEGALDRRDPTSPNTCCIRSPQ